MTRALPPNPRPEASERKSPNDVPRVLENRIAVQYSSSPPGVVMRSTLNVWPLYAQMTKTAIRPATRISAPRAYWGASAVAPPKPRLR